MGNVHVIHMVAGDNRFNAKFVSAFNRALDEVEAFAGPTALVTTGAGKFYSNGLDLDWMAGEGREQVDRHLARVHDTFVRMLTFPMITVAALNGHTFAAGAMLALAHDYRVMRADRGFFCLPEVDIKIPFTPQMDALIRARLPKSVAHEAMCTGKRYGGIEAAARQIVDHAVAEAEVLPKALDIAQGLAGKDRGTLATIKRTMYSDVCKVFVSPTVNLGSLLSEREIYRCIMAIARAMDDRDWEVLRQIFAPNINAELGLGNICGAEEVISFIRSFLDNCGTTQHLIGNVVVDVDGTTATSTCYVCDMHLGKDTKSELSFRTMGEYKDSWQQQNGRWVLTRRVKDNRATIGSMDVFSP